MFSQVIPVEGAIAGHDQIMLGLVAVLGTLAGVLVVAIRNGNAVKVAAREATAANHAVNNIGPEKEHTIFTMVEMLLERQNEFDRRWGALPPEMGDAVGLVELLHSLDRRLTDIDARLAEHVAWEMTQKYPKA